MKEVMNQLEKSNLVFNWWLSIFPELKLPPKFLVKPMNKTVDPETDVLLKCSASGSPQPTLLWRRGRERILGNPDLSLSINNIKTSAWYTCTAFNSEGTIKAAAYISVRGKTTQKCNLILGEACRIAHKVIRKTL